MSATPRFIITLTSYPARIATAHITVETLLRQTLKPDMIALYLGYDKFPNREGDLPPELVAQTRRGLSIHWVKDIGCFTTLVPALDEFPEDVILNVDDDIVYPPTLAAACYESYRRDPACIHSTVAHKILFDRKGHIVPYCRWGDWRGTTAASFQNFIISTHGTLYPPHCLHEDVKNVDLARKLCPSNDDIWFWAQALRKGTKIRVVERKEPLGAMVTGTQDVGLCVTNSVGPNDEQLQRVLKHYPDILKLLKTEPLEIVPRTDKVFYFRRVPYLGLCQYAARQYKVYLFNLVPIPFLRFHIEENFVSVSLYIGREITFFRLNNHKQNKLYRFFKPRKNEPRHTIAGGPGNE